MAEEQDLTQVADDELLPLIDASLGRQQVADLKGDKEAVAREQEARTRIRAEIERRNEAKRRREG